jgi:hypothetical protein
MRNAGDGSMLRALLEELAGIARHISVQSAAIASFFRPVFFTASTTRRSPTS